MQAAIQQLSEDPEYDMIFKLSDPFDQQVIRANQIVQQFIIKHQLIIYGGTAIDFNLRLKGDQEYDDRMLPRADFDFFSPRHAEHSYQLADELYEAGFDQTRVIVASHYTTMRVDIGDLHFIADISYQPGQVPTNLFQGMRIVSPLFQYMDVHLSLSLPYYDPPREAIFNRWKKDIKRFNKLYKYYPVEAPKVDSPTHQVELGPDQRKYVFQGHTSLAIMQHIAGQQTATLKANKIILQQHSPAITIIHIQPNKVKLDDPHTYDPFANFIPSRIEGVQNGIAFHIFNTHNELTSIDEVIIHGHTLRICNIQTCLKWFLGMYFTFQDPSYLQHYTELLKLTSIFKPSILTYGGNNITHSQQISLGKIKSALYGDAVLKALPSFYTPKQARAGQHPSFDYLASPYFALEGKEQINEQDTHVKE